MREGETVALAATPAEAQLLAFAEASGQIALALRPMAEEAAEERPAPTTIATITGGHDDDPRTTPSSQVFWVVIAQIAVIDIVFSLDSVITAVGIADHIPVMIFAILLAVAVMLLAANPLGRFIDGNPTVKMLALAFILLIGVVLILDGFDVHVPKPYIYFAMAFSVLVEVFNLLMRQHAAKRHVPGAGEW